jgi:hypothetical protein
MFIASINAKKILPVTLLHSFLLSHWSVGRIRIQLFISMRIQIQGAKLMRIHVLSGFMVH